MNDEIKRLLQHYVGDVVALTLRTGSEVTGKIVWLSPDRCMVELECSDREIKTFIHDDIKKITCVLH
ncbi:MAG TPA: hypothetical protein VJ824_10015 [Bacillota bacterium]|nr:hypothetical protein [Bacillota bacterium]